MGVEGCITFRGLQETKFKIIHQHVKLIFYRSNVKCLWTLASQIVAVFRYSLSKPLCFLCVIQCNTATSYTYYQSERSLPPSCPPQYDGPLSGIFHSGEESNIKNLYEKWCCSCCQPDYIILRPVNCREKQENFWLYARETLECCQLNFFFNLSALLISAWSLLTIRRRVDVVIFYFKLQRKFLKFSVWPYMKHFPNL